MHQNLLFDSAEEARALSVGELSMAVCPTCSFVFNRAFDPGLLSYGEHYDNAQNFSPAFESHVDALVDRLVNQKGVRDCSVVEVGCGKGEFLRKLIDRSDVNNLGWGFDPAYLGPDEDLDGRLKFHRCFYDENCAETVADVVVCRHVIEHVPEPRDLLSNIRAALSGSPNARVFFETPCVEWILRNEVAWDFFYEHCSLFTDTSLARVFEECGFEVCGVDHVFGGQYLWLEAVVSQNQSTGGTLTTAPSVLSRLATSYGQTEIQRNDRWQNQITAQRNNGAMALWGAGAKGVTFANLIDCDATQFAAVVDVNPNKQGKFLAGTGHPIIAPAELVRHGVRTVLVLNPNYLSEIRADLASQGMAVSVIDLMNQGAVAA